MRETSLKRSFYQQAMTSAAGELPIFDAGLQRNPGRVEATRR